MKVISLLDVVISFMELEVVFSKALESADQLAVSKYPSVTLANQLAEEMSKRVTYELRVSLRGILDDSGAI